MVVEWTMERTGRDWAVFTANIGEHTYRMECETWFCANGKIAQMKPENLWMDNKIELSIRKMKRLFEKQLEIGVILT